MSEKVSYTKPDAIQLLASHLSALQIPATPSNVLHMNAAYDILAALERAAKKEEQHDSQNH